MDILFIFIAALLPAALLWFYIWKQDAKKEPTTWLLRAVLYGVLICLPVALLEMAISSLLFDPGTGPQTIFGTTVEAFLCAAIPEECFKLLALWLILRHNSFYDEHYDGIVYAVSVGLGFAGIENLLYLFGYYSENWVSVAFLRSLMAVPGHYAFAVIMGYYYSVYHFVDRSPQVAACIIGIPILAHGVYDALLLTSQVDMALGSSCVIIVIFLLVKLHKYAQRRVVEQIEKDRIC